MKKINGPLILRHAIPVILVISFYEIVVPDLFYDTPILKHSIHIMSHVFADLSFEVLIEYFSGQKNLLKN